MIGAKNVMKQKKINSFFLNATQQRLNNMASVRNVTKGAMANTKIKTQEQWHAQEIVTYE